MPHLHLPADHTDADLVLAANVADVVGSEDLYVVWTEDRGAGVPEVQAVLCEARPQVGLAAAFAALCVAFWHALTGRSGARAESAEPAAAVRREPAPGDELRH